MPRQTPFRVGVCYRDLAASSGSGFLASSSRQKDEGTRRSGSSCNNASWSCGGDGTAPVVRWIGNMFPPPPLFLHDPGRLQGTQGEPSRLGGCFQTLDVERVRPQTTRRQSVTETRAHGFDSRRLHRYRALQSVPHPTRWQEITQSARADLDWPTTRPHEWDTRTSASQIRCSTSAATRTRILPSSNSPRSRQRWVRHQVLSQESASMSLSPLGGRAALVSELVDIHVRNRG